MTTQKEKVEARSPMVQADGSRSPFRETARITLERDRDELLHKLAMLEALLEIAKKAEPGSPLEEALWTTTRNLRF